MVNRREKLLDGVSVEEVMFINRYAVFLSYLSMAIRGLGFLVLTWTTVVLLGGFVSMLERKDFWCLTFITLVQTAGIFDVVLNEKLRYMVDAVSGLTFGIFGIMIGDWQVSPPSLALLLLACVLVVVQMLVLGALLCPMAVIYVFGISISGVISMWRLVEHDYSVNSNSVSDGEAANLAPAMDTLYYLALLQSVLFCYRFSLGRLRKRLSKKVATDKGDHQVIDNYLCEIRIGCEKDPSFAKGRNLITHAIDMIGSSSPSDCVFGVKILYTAISTVERNLEQLELQGEKESFRYHGERDNLSGQRMLMKHLVLSTPSSRHLLQKLLEMLDSIGLHDTETRSQAAMIVERLAVSINLEQFPRGIERISSLLGTFEQYTIAEPYQRDSLFDLYERQRGPHLNCIPSLKYRDNHTLMKSYKDLLLLGFCIVEKLAADENNCRVMSATRDLVSKIMSPITSDLLHQTIHDHGAWSKIVEKSMEVMIKLAGAPRETGTKLRREISICEEAINTLWRILNCNECNEKLQQTAIQILTRLYMDSTESSRSSNYVVLKKERSKEDFVRMLVDIFTKDNKSISIRKCSGMSLLEFCFRGRSSDATIVTQTNGGDAVDSLTKVLVHDENKICRQRAAEILEQLCTHYTQDDEYLGKLKKAMTDAMPKILEEILRVGDETHTGEDRSTRQESDIENQCDNGQGTGVGSSSSSRPQKNVEDEDENALLSSLLSLCGMVYTMVIGELGLDLASQFHASSFLNKLNKMLLVKKSDRPTVKHLLVFKAIAKVVVLLMKHSSSRFAKRENLHSLMEALSTASKNMLDLDYSMVFSSADSGSATISSNLSKRTLASLVKEAQDLQTSVPSTSVSG